MSGAAILKSMFRFATILVFFSFFPMQGQASRTAVAQSGRLLEATEYSACGYNCAPFNRPTTAYCIQAGSETLVGERTTVFGESQTKSLRSLVGQGLTFRADSSSIWLLVPGQRALKVKRGALFEGFKDNHCAAAVHSPILKEAATDARPSQVPKDAFALPADGKTVPLYRWFQCSVDSVDSDIICKKWDPKGGWRGVERYCPRTRDGTAVGADLDIDHLLSREGRIVLRGEHVLLPDGRGRVNDQLERPFEPCRQMSQLD